MKTRGAVPVDELLAGYSQARERQMGIMMGGLGVTMTHWMESLEQPSTQATIVAVASALVSALCFRVASLIDANDRNSGARL